MNKVFAVVVAAAFIMVSALALADPDKGASSVTPAQQIANETASAVANVLTGGSSQAASETGTPPGLAKKGGVPPGLAKKGGVPPGQAKKPNWKRDHPHVDSPIDMLVKGLFGKKESK